MAKDDDFDENGSPPDAGDTLDLGSKSKIVDGLIALHDVEKASGYPTHIAERWLTRKIAAGRLRAWETPWFKDDEYVPDSYLNCTKMNKNSELDALSRRLPHWEMSDICLMDSQFREALASDFPPSPLEVGGKRPTDPNEPVEGIVPLRRQCVPYLVAVERVRAASGFSDDAAKAYLFDALFVQARIPAWTRPTRSSPGWMPVKGSADLSLVYVMCKVLDQALAVEFPRAESPWKPLHTNELPEQFQPSGSTWVDLEYDKLRGEVLDKRVDATAAMAAARPPAESEAGVKARCQEWLKSEMLKSPDRSPKSKTVWRTEAKKLFPGLSGRVFDDRAWPEAIRETGAKWSEPGRKSSR